MAVNEVCDAVRVRVGSCKQCGQCCQRLGWILIHADDDTIDWIQVHDSEIQIVSDDDVQGYYWMSVPYPCKQLIDLGDGKFGCKMHEKKPAVCRRYPEVTDELKPGCGYFFVEIVPGAGEEPCVN